MKNLSFLIIAVTLLIGLDYVGAWTAPTNNPPNQNVAAPVHTGTAMQYKSGILSADTFQAPNEVWAGSKMRSPLYCDIAGGNCLGFQPGNIVTVSTLRASSSVNADQFCAADGTNCITQGSLGGGGGAGATVPRPPRCNGNDALQWNGSSWNCKTNAFAKNYKDCSGYSRVISRNVNREHGEAWIRPSPNNATDGIYQCWDGQVTVLQQYRPGQP